MSKIAIVGCQQSGKTVFMASLSDYFRAGQREGQACWLIPENSGAHNFTEMRNYEMRILGIWPEATLASPTSLKWSLRQKDGTKTDIEMLEFSGEVFRAAFREDGSTPQHKEAAEELVSYLIDAEFVVVLVGLNELFRTKDDQAVFKDDIESTWVTRGLIDFVKNNLPPRVGLIIALTQADLYKNELEHLGGATGVLKSKWPMIYALYPDIPVVAVASVSETTADGRPAEGYTTEGVLPVMKAYSEFLYGNPDSLISELNEIATFVANISQACPLDTIEQKIARHKQLFEELSKRVAIVDALFDGTIKKHRALNEECEGFLAALRAILPQPVEQRIAPSLWDGLRAEFPAMTKTVNAFEADAHEQNRLMLAEKARLEEDERIAREKEARRLEESAKQDDERRRRLELVEREQQASAEALRLQKEKSRIASRALAIRAFIALLIVLAIGISMKKWRDSAEQQRLARMEKTRQMEQERKARIESENAVKLAEVRKAEAALRALEEKNRAEELARKRLEEENRQNELELKRQEAARIAAEEEQRKIDVENERRRLEIERQKAQEERMLEEERRKRLEEENRKRQIEIAHESALRKEEEERQRRIEEQKENESKELARKEKERIAEEEKARKLEEDRRIAKNLLERSIAAINENSAEQAKWLIEQLKSTFRLLPAESQTLFDNVCMSCETLEKAESGDEDAMVAIANQFHDGSTVVKKDRASAYRWYLKAADAGNPLSQCKVGEMLAAGDGVAKNLTLAHTYFLKSAAMNNANAQYAAAEMYRTGNGVEKNDRKANKLYERAAELGNPDAQFRWYQRLGKGEGMLFCKKKESFEWLFKAAKSGHGKACYLIGCQYLNGSVYLKSSVADAYDMFKKAKDAGFKNDDLEQKLSFCKRVLNRDL